MKIYALCFFSYFSIIFGLDNCLSRDQITKLAIQTDPKDVALLNYISKFPIEEYEVVHSRSLGTFLVEHNSQDMIKQIIRAGWHREGHVVFPLWKFIRPGSVIVDMGGHIGTHTVTFASHVGPQGTVHVFEPQMKIFVELLANLELNGCKNVVAHRAALGNQNGWIEMNPGCPTNEGGVSVGQGGDRARLMKLDDLHLQNVSIMKIDVEGMEMQAIEGAIETIKNNYPALAVEIMSDVLNKIQYIESLGYTSKHLGMDDFLFIPK